MSEDIHNVVLDVLTPLVGRAMATVYASKATHRPGKLLVGLTADDLPAISEEIRQSVRPFTTRAVVDEVIAEITRRVRG